MKKHSLFRVSAALLLMLAMLLQLCVPAFAEGEEASDKTVYLNSAEDILNLSKNCRYDAWSEGKTVVLQKDISLSGVDFTPIASFSGTFEGNYHTITGLNITGNYSPAGFFGMIEETGTVRCLNLEGYVAPGGSADMAGGVAGINRGIIDNCSFAGTVNGQKRVGGIAGENAYSGIIRRSRSNGGVFGKDRSGGIAGNNRGSISSCNNRAYVNTHSLDPSISFEGLNLNFANGISGLASPDIYNLTVDTGGIAGYSDGNILSCRNYGSVGYQHIGYNLGGIAGRSSGHIAYCINDGTVFGRREVGGIAGMAEPFVKLDLSEDNVAKLREQLNTLSRTVDKTLSDAANSSAAVSMRVTAIGDSVNNAADKAQKLTNGISDIIDADIAEVNRGSEILDNSLDRLAAVISDFRTAVDSVNDAAGYVNRAIDKLENGSGGSVIANLQNSVELLQHSSDIIGAGIEKMQKGMDDLVDEIDDAPSIDKLDLDDVGDALEKIAKGIEIIMNGRGFIKYGDTGGAMSYIKDAMDLVSAAMVSADESVQELKKASECAEKATNGLTVTMRDAEQLMDYLNAQEALKFKDTGGLREDSDALYNSVRGISDNIELLNQEVKGSADLLIADVRLINQQFNALMNTLLDITEEINNVSSSDYLRDTSDEDIHSAISGKVLSCSNTGSVDGDYDAGGIAGSMMIYNSLNPESSEAITSASLRRHYELKCILLSCRNEGRITGKEDNIGAVCGYGRFGVISGCEGYGSAGSSGNYVGGIAGYAVNTVRGCWAKTSLSGGKYVGGIVGGSSDEDSDLLIEKCFALPEITECQQYSGAIIGNMSGTLKDNRFVSEYLAGAGTVSRKGQAEPLSYDEAMADPEIPDRFRMFTLDFIANGENVLSIPFNYGDGFMITPEFPFIPKVEGKYGYWDRTDLRKLYYDTTVTAVYEQELTALKSEVSRSAQRPAFFVEGAFDGSEEFGAQPEVFDFELDNEGLLSILRSFRRSVQEQWRLTLPDDGLDSHYVRYLPPEMAGGHISLYMLADGRWQRIEAEKFGSYYRFPVEGKTAEITVTAGVTPWWIWVLTVLFIVAELLLIADLVIRRRRKSDAGEGEKADIENTRRKKKKYRIILVVLLLVLGLAMHLAIRLVPRISRSLELYNLLNNYSHKSELDMNLELVGSLRGQNFDTEVNMFVTECAGEKLSCVQWEGSPLYFCNNTIIMENGKCYRAEGLMADYSQIFTHAASMYSAIDVNVSEQNGVRTYHAEAAGEDARKIVSVIIPGSEDLIGSSDVVDLNLTVTDGEMSSLDVSWSGQDGKISAKVKVLESAKEHEIPVEVSSAVSAKAYVNAEDISADFKAILLAWTEFAVRDPLEAEVKLSANAGPVILSENLLWERTGIYGKNLNRVSRRGRVIYFTEDGFCSDKGELIETDVSSYVPEDLMRMVYQMLLLSEINREDSGSGTEYSVTLDESAMDGFSALVAPQIRDISISHSSGTAKVLLKNGAISEIEIVCRGTIPGAVNDIFSSVSARMSFAPDPGFETPPWSVIRALELEE